MRRKREVVCVACCAEVLRAVLVLVSVFFFCFFLLPECAKYMGYLALRSRLSLPLGHYHDGGSSSFSNSSTKIDPLPPR